MPRVGICLPIQLRQHPVKPAGCGWDGKTEGDCALIASAEVESGAALVRRRPLLRP